MAREEIAGEDARSVGEVVADVVAALPAPQTRCGKRRGAVHSAQQAEEFPEKRPQDAAPAKPISRRWRQASAVKGMLQNLVVEPETDGEGKPTGFYCVAIGEGGRLAYLLLAKRKKIKKAQPVRCVLDTANDPAEISLDENVTREALSVADQVERFRELSENRDGERRKSPPGSA